MPNFDLCALPPTYEIFDTPLRWKNDPSSFIKMMSCNKTVVSVDWPSWSDANYRIVSIDYWKLRVVGKK